MTSKTKSKMKQNTASVPAPNPRKGKWLFGLLGVVVLIGAGGLAMTTTSGAADIVVYKSPTCGCCSNWVDHLKQAGFSVEVHQRQDMASVKSELGVPRQFQSCHTAKVGDYVVEGHVPADLIKRMLAEHPPIRGLAVPGMPMGSPGMDGPRKDPYDVLTFDQAGHTSVYAHR